MSAQLWQGKQSIRLDEPVYINGNASVVGKKEGEGPLGLLFDMVGEDDMFGCNTWEEAESSLQKDAVSLALGKAGKKAEEIRYVFAGDLLGQSIATSFGIMNYRIPLFGVYGACSTCGETLSLGAMTVAGGFAEQVLCVTSSHFASAEKAASTLRHLDSNRKRRLYIGKRKRSRLQGENYRHDSGKDCGFRTEGLTEHGGMHGACGSRPDRSPFDGFSCKTGRLR